MNTWGKRPAAELPADATFEEVTTKRFRFGDCPVSLPTECPTVPNSVVVVQPNGSSSWASNLPVGPGTGIESIPTANAKVTCVSDSEINTTLGGHSRLKVTDPETVVSGPPNGVGFLRCEAQTTAICVQDASIIPRVVVTADTTGIQGPDGLVGVECARTKISAQANTLQLDLSLQNGAGKVLTCVDVDGVAEWRDLPPAAPVTRIQDTANTCSVVCDNGDVTMTGAGGEYIQCVGDEISMNNQGTQVILFQAGIVMGSPSGEIMYTDSVTHRFNGPGGAANLSLKPTSAELVAPVLQLVLPSSGTDKVLKCLNSSGLCEWSDLPPAGITNRIENTSNTSVACVTPSTILATCGATESWFCRSDAGAELIRLRAPKPNNNKGIKMTADDIVIVPRNEVPAVGDVLTAIDTAGTSNWLPPTVPNRITNTAGTIEVVCNANSLFVKAPGPPTIGRVLSCVDNTGIAEWRFPLGYQAVFGGRLSNPSNRVMYFDSNATQTVQNSLSVVGVNFVVPFNCRIESYTFDMEAGDATTAITINKNLSVISTEFPQSLGLRRGVRAFASATNLLTLGDEVALRWSAGTAPNNTLIALYVVPF